MNQVYFQTQNRKSTKRMIFTGCCCCCYFPGLVGIDVRMIFCLIFKWFTLFSCKLSRNKLVLISLFRSLSSSSIHISSADYRQILLYIFLLFAFHFNTLKHFFSFAIISCKQLLLLDSSHVTTTLLFCFCFFFLQFATIAATRVWSSVIVNVFYSFSFILLVWVWMCLVSFLLSIFFLFLF